jgi:hypothetical protein
MPWAVLMFVFCCCSVACGASNMQMSFLALGWNENMDIAVGVGNDCGDLVSGELEVLGENDLSRMIMTL